MKVLNLYAGIGGNRKLWQDVEITAVELNDEIAGIYKEYFPQDKVIVTDAHEYLLNHYKEFDFIWSSPPCPTHSRARFWKNKDDVYRVKYPDMKLWQEIIFLEHHADCKWVIENVVPYYEPFLPPTAELQRHLFWSNFKIRPTEFKENDFELLRINNTNTIYGFNLIGKKITREKNTITGNVRKDTVLRNLVNPDLGLYILEQARGIIRESKSSQQSLFA